MLRNYIGIAFRNLARHKLYSTINVLGLAIGLALSLAFSTAAFQAIRAATANPVDSLRYE